MTDQQSIDQTIDPTLQLITEDLYQTIDQLRYQLREIDPPTQEQTNILNILAAPMYEEIMVRLRNPKPNDTDQSYSVTLYIVKDTIEPYVEKAREILSLQSQEK